MDTAGERTHEFSHRPDVFVFAAISVASLLRTEADELDRRAAS